MLVLACDPDPEPVGEGPTSDGGSDSMSSTTGDSADTTDPSASGASNSESSSTTTEGETSPPTTTATTSGAPTGGSGTTDSTETGETTDGPPADCDIEELVCEHVENSKVLPEDIVDCGFAMIGDAPEVYMDVRECVLEASEGQQAYKAFVELQGIDSMVVAAYSSLVGFAYTEHYWLYDSMGPTAARADCTPIPTEKPSCVPGPKGGLCLECDTKGALVCPKD